MAIVGVPTLWGHLRPLGRLGLIGIVAATLATVILFATAAAGRRAAIDAERLAISLELLAVAAVIGDLGGRLTLDVEEELAVDALFARLLADPTRTGAKLWSLDGTIIRSDNRASEGTRFAAAAPWIRGAADEGFATNDSETDDPAAFGRPTYGDQIDLYVAVPHPSTGEPLAVVEVHESNPALAAVMADGPDRWLMVGAAFFVLVMSVVAFVASTARVTLTNVAADRGAVAALAALPSEAVAAALPAGDAEAGLAPSFASLVPPAGGVRAGPPPADPELRLSRRQLEVLEGLCAGLAAKEIAAKLGLAEGTVGVYTKELYRRLDVTSRAGAVAVALRRGLVR